jgi:arsenite/tail-anchored protein-transporting ATPase
MCVESGEDGDGMGLENILDKNVGLIMIGGKGGVGKTTCASAIAVRIAVEGKKVLIISSDPTPSLSDIFEVAIGGVETKIDEQYELYGLEISSEVVLKKWKERFGPEIYEVISSFAKVDYDFVDYIGTAPGIEEEYMLSFIVGLVESGKYDVVVWDTAPAGHTLRLLHLPHLFLKHLEAATKFYMNMYSYLERLKQMSGLKGSRKTLLAIIKSWEELSQKIIEFIKDSSATKYVIVTIPEALGVKLTERMLEEFERNGLEAENIIINHVVEVGDCPFHRERKEMQKHYIDFMEDRYKDMNLTKLYLSPHEVKGMKRIMEVAKELFR